MEIIFHARFRRKLEKLPVKTQGNFYKRLKIFTLDIRNPILNNHPLKGRYSGYRSINITGDFRAIYEQQGDIFLFENIGTHSELYK